MRRISISKETKQTLIGGVAAAVALNMESAANALVAGYPQILKDRLNPSLPRNGELLADLAPVGITWAVAKKKHSSRVQNVKTGVTLYDLPKLVDLIAYRIAYQAGLPSAAMRTSAMRLNIAPRMNIAPVRLNRPLVGGGQVITPVGAGAKTGKYTIQSNAKAPMSGGIGKYR